MTAYAIYALLGAWIYCHVTHWMVMAFRCFIVTIETELKDIPGVQQIGVLRRVRLVAGPAVLKRNLMLLGAGKLRSRVTGQTHLDTRLLLETASKANVWPMAKYASEVIFHRRMYYWLIERCGKVFMAT